MDDLKSFLITRLLIVMGCVLAAEALLLFPVQGILLPAAARLARLETAGSFHLADVLAILNALFFGSGQTAVIGIFARPGAVLLLLLAALLLLAPLAAGVMIYTRIVTARVDELQRQRDAEREAYNKQRNLMLSDFAHDLRTPITTISGYAQALDDGLITDPETRREYLRAIRRKSARMSELISLLFEYVKLGSAGYSLNKKDCDLNALAAEITASLYTDIEDAGMELTVEIPETPFPVEADRTQAGRILGNLLTNAIRHNPKGTKIAVLVRRLAGLEIVAVADDGAPIEEDVRRLFEPFVTEDASRSGDKGSGLGLSISKKAADMHGWELTLLQPYEQYTKAFVLRVPEK